MRAWRRIGGTRPPAGEQEFFLLAQGLRQEIERTYGEKFRQLAAKLLPITFGSDDVAEMGALRLIRAADVQKLEDDLKKGLSPQEALKSFPIIPLEEGISAILSRKVDCVFVNGSGNNRIQAISNAGKISALRKGIPLTVLHQYLPLDAPVDWAPSKTLQLAEPNILSLTAIAAATSVVGEEGEHVPIASHSAGAIVPSFAYRIIGDVDAKANVRAFYFNPALPPSLFAEMMVPKIEQPMSHSHISTYDGLGFLAMAGTLLTQPLLLGPSPDVVVSAVGHDFAAALSHWDGKVADGDKPFQAIVQDTEKGAKRPIGVVRRDGSKLASIFWGDPQAPAAPINPDQDYQMDDDGGVATYETYAKEAAEAKVPDLEELRSDREKEEKKPDPPHRAGGDREGREGRR